MIRAIIKIYFLNFTFKCREQREWPFYCKNPEKYILSKIRKFTDEIKYMYIT